MANTLFVGKKNGELVVRSNVNFEFDPAGEVFKAFTSGQGKIVSEKLSDIDIIFIDTPYQSMNIYVSPETQQKAMEKAMKEVEENEL